MNNITQSKIKAIKETYLPKKVRELFIIKPTKDGNISIRLITKNK